MAPFTLVAWMDLELPDHAGYFLTSLNMLLPFTETAFFPD